MFVLSKKDKANPLLMECRKLLLNQVDVGKDGRLVAVDEIRTFRYGAAEGEHKVRISGITTRDFFYRTKYNRVKAVYQASEAMKDIGRRADLSCMEDAAACIIKSPIFYPVVIVFYENIEGRMQLSTFTAKAFLSLFAINSAIKKFDRQLPDTMVRKVSVHSVHDVNMAIIHSFKKLINKEDDSDDGDYVDLKKLLKKGRQKGRNVKREFVNQRNIYNESSDSISMTDDSQAQDSPEVDNGKSRESREEKRARKKALRLEKKREAARRKYEKLMGDDLVKPSVEDGYSEEEENDDDIMLEFTGMNRDELEAMEESGDYNNSYEEQNSYDDYEMDEYDNYESDEDTLRELTGMSSSEMDAYNDSSEEERYE